MIVIRKVARHAGHGRFVTKGYAHRFPWLTVVETIRFNVPRKRLRRRSR
jgi:hypothetical protein